MSSRSVYFHLRHAKEDVNKVVVASLKAKKDKFSAYYVFPTKFRDMQFHPREIAEHFNKPGSASVNFSNFKYTLKGDDLAKYVNPEGNFWFDSILLDRRSNLPDQFSSKFRYIAVIEICKYLCKVYIILSKRYRYSTFLLNFCYYCFIFCVFR